MNVYPHLSKADEFLGRTSALVIHCYVGLCVIMGVCQVNLIIPTLDSQALVVTMSVVVVCS